MLVNINNDVQCFKKSISPAPVQKAVMIRFCGWLHSPELNRSYELTYMAMAYGWYNLISHRKTHRQRGKAPWGPASIG